MPDHLTLIHLVSEQTLQNLLPLMALRPARVIQIRSADHRFAAIAANLEAAARESGYHPEFITRTLSESAPGIDSIRHAIKQYLPIFPTAIVNITGGTKLMSIGAFLGAGEFHGVPILYCDTVNRTFGIINNLSLPPDTPTLPDVAARLTVRTVMAAHGKSPDDWRFDTASAAALNFGRTAWHLQTSHPADLKPFGSAVRAYYRDTKGKIPSATGKLQSLLQADISDAIPGGLTEPVSRFLDAATAAGFLILSENGGHRIAPGPENRDKLRSHIEGISNLLNGSWLELSVLDFLTRSPRHRDPHWSVEPTAPAQDRAEYGETDLIAVDTQSAVLEVISCKTALSQPLEHLEGLRTRAENLGGSHARATLAVLHAGDPAAHQRLRRWGKLLRVNVLIGPEIPAYFK